MANINNERRESEEEALFGAYPYAVYFVQSPSISHANTNPNLALSLSRYSSSLGSNNSFNKKLENTQKCVQILSHHKDDDDDDDDDQEKNKGGWIKYLSFSYSDSGWWILLQLSWRFLVSFFIALLVFYVAAKPPAPNFSIKVHTNFILFFINYNCV